jgi:hypothetical protein
LKAEAKKDPRELIFGNACNLGREETCRLLESCGTIGISAFMKIYIGYRNLLYVRHTDPVDLELGDALAALSLRGVKRVVLQPDHPRDPQREAECASRAEMMLIPQGIDLVILTKDDDVISRISVADRCLYITDISRIKDPFSTLNRLGCKYLAIDYDPNEHEPTVTLAQTLRLGADIGMFLFTKELTNECKEPLGDGIVVITDVPVELMICMESCEKA